MLKTTTAGVVGAAGIAAFSGTALANCPCAADGGTCERLGKIDETPVEGKSYFFDYQGETVEVKVENIEMDGGDVISADLVTPCGSNEALCKVEVKGGPDAKVYDCSDSTTNFSYDSDCCFGRAFNLQSPTNPANGKPFEISHITLHICDFNGDGPGDGGICEPNDDCDECD